jgi:uncharacterized protein GlcG (DUF336 family)
MPKLTLEQANTIIRHAFARSHELKTKPLGVVVVDDGGNTISAQRDDGASMFRIDVGLGKAWAAVAIGFSSREVGKRAKANPTFFVSLAATGQGKFIPQTGAVLITDADGNILGAAGASGAAADEDEGCCIYGIEKAGFKVGIDP